jgi:hypothetical protein
MFNFFTKLIFFLKKPKLIIVAGKDKEAAAEAIYSVLKQYFRAKKIQKINSKSILGAEVLIAPMETEAAEIFDYAAKKARLLVLVVTHIEEKKKAKEIFALAKALPYNAHLVLNFDDEMVREIDDLTNLRPITFGFQERADFQASDIRLNGGTNFKINYHGNIVPFWLEKLLNKEQIYTVLAAGAVGIIFGLNLVKISQSLKDYKGLFR